MTYFGDFGNRTDVEDQFGTKLAEDAYILVAVYDGYDYEGSAFVLFLEGDKLYEVHGSHCSCYGLEDQWQPEETDWKSILHRLEKGDLFWGFGSYNEQIQERLKYLNRMWDLLAADGHEGCANA